MSRKLVAVAALSVIGGFAGITSASAYDRFDRTDVVQGAQQRQIQSGIRSGEITRFEAQKLQAEQARIAAMERRAEADGRIDRHERAQLNQAQREAGRHIRQESHDRQDRDHNGRYGRRWFGWWR